MTTTLAKLGFTALGVAVIGTTGMHFAARSYQKSHRTQDYCTVPLQKLVENQRGTQLLGGCPVHMTALSNKAMHITETKAQLKIPVKGNTRSGQIYTLSTRSTADEKWSLEYAVMHIVQGQYKWVVWLHPDEGVDSNVEAMLPDEVKQLEST